MAIRFLHLLFFNFANSEITDLQILSSFHQLQISIQHLSIFCVAKYTSFKQPSFE